MASLVNRNMTVVDKSDAVNVGTTSPKQDSDFEHNKNRYLRFYVLVLGILFFFGCHNYLQELIMTLPGFKVRSDVRIFESSVIFVVYFSGRCFSWISGSTWCSCLLARGETYPK